MTSESTALNAWLERGDAEAFRTLVQRYSGMVFGTCQRVLRNAPEAEDVTQECFEALATIRRAPRAVAVGAWLHTVAVNRTLNRIRSQDRRRARETAYAANQPDATEFVWDDIYAYVDEAIAALPERVKTPLIAHYLESRSMRDVARQLNLAPSTVAARIDKGIHEIRKHLRKRGITVTTAALGGLFAANLSHAAVPQALVASLAKIGLAGAGQAGVASVAAAGIAGAGIAMKTVLAALVLLAAFGGVFLISSLDEGTPVVQDAKAASSSDQEFAPGRESLAERRNGEPTRDAMAGNSVKPEQNTITSGRGTIYGCLFDDTRRPVPDAEVKLYAGRWEVTVVVDLSAAAQTTKTDSHGLFSFDRLPKGGYACVATVGESTGVAMCSVGSPEYLVTASTTSDENLNTVTELHLTTVTPIAGRVIDESGNGIASAQVLLHPSAVTLAQLAWPFGLSTDADGKFAFPWLLPGTYKAIVLTEEYGPRAFPDIPTGQVGVELQIQTGNSVHGRVVEAATNTPVTDAEVRLLAEDLFGQDTRHGLEIREEALDPFVTVAHTDGSGEFHANKLAAGKYFLGIDHESIILSNPQEAFVVSVGSEPANAHVEVETGGVISGTVRDLESGAGVGGARVSAMLTSEPRRYFQGGADQTGSYRIAGVIPGDYTVRVLRAPTDPKRSVTVGPGEVLADIDFDLQPAAAVRGVVVDAAGTPLEGASIYASDDRGNWYGSAISGRGGSFSFPAVPPGAKFDIRGQWFHCAGVLNDVGIATDAAPFTVRLILDQERSCSIAGTVARAREADETLLVYVRSLDRVTSVGTLVEADGTFFVGGLISGRYEVYTTKPYREGSSTSPYTERVEVVLADGESKTGLLLPRVESDPTAEKTFAISGSVRDTKGNPIAGATITTPSAGIDATSDENGRYRVEGLPEGVYTLRAYHDKYSGQELRDIYAGSERVDFTLQDTGTLEGVIIDATNSLPVSGARVCVEHDLDRFFNDKFVGISDTSGRFQISNVPGGDLGVMVKAEGYFEGRPPTEVQPGQTSQIRVLLEPGGVLEGVVVEDATGEPIRGAAVCAGPTPPSRSLSAVARTNAEGHFVLDSLSEYEKTLWVEHPGYATTSQLFSWDEPQPIEVRVGSGGSIKVTVHGITRLGCSINIQTDAYPPQPLLYETLKSDGSQTFAAIGPGNYIVLALLHTPEGTRAARQYAIVEEGRTTPVEFDLRLGTAGLSGIVSISGAAMALGYVEVMVTNDSGSQTFNTECLQSSGAYTFVGLPAGSAEVVARTWTVGDDDPQTQAKSLELVDGVMAQQDFAFGATARISGTVTGIREAGSGVSLLRGEFYVEDFPQETLLNALLERLVQTNNSMAADGPYEFEGVQPGVYTLIAWTAPPPGSMDHWSYKQKIITVESTDDLTFDFVLE